MEGENAWTVGMTRLESVERAIEIISKEESVEGKSQILENLEKVKILLKNEWTKDAIIDKISQWAIEHGRNPCYSDLSQYDDLPNPIAVKRAFDMRATAFLNLYYPHEKKASVTYVSVMSKEEIVTLFVTQFEKHEVHSAKEYDTLKDDGTPCWLTIARKLGLTKWNELVAYAGVKIKKRSPVVVRRVITVRHSIPLHEKLEQLLKERK